MPISPDILADARLRIASKNVRKEDGAFLLIQDGSNDSYFSKLWSITRFAGSVLGYL